MRSGPKSQHASKADRRFTRRNLRLGLILLALGSVVASLLVGVSGSSATTAASYQTPASVDSWYAAPSNLSGMANGTVIRSRGTYLSFLGLPLPIQSWQLLYKSTDAKGQPVADSTSLIIPLGSFGGPGPRPLVSYQAAEDSVGAQCAPGFSLTSFSNPAVIGDVLQASQALLHGWALAIPDYEGPESQFIAGAQAGHAVLDGVRAVQHFSPSGLNPQTPTALWGYSGGGAATGWASELQSSYAPELKVVGTAEGGVPADLGMLVNQINGGVFAGFEFIGVLGLWRAYPEMALDPVLNQAGRDLLNANQNSCLGSVLLQGAFKKLDDYTVRPNVIAEPLYQSIMAQNKLGQRMPAAPVFNYGAMFDQIVPSQGNDNLVAAYCAGGVKVVKERYLLAEHVTAAAEGLFSALNFLGDRFAGKPVQSTC